MRFLREEEDKQKRTPDLIFGRKTAEEVKSGLRHCWNRCKGGEDGDCPYYDDCRQWGCTKNLEKDALALIEHLETKQQPELAERLENEIMRRDNLLAEMGIHLPPDEPTRWEYKTRGEYRKVTSDGWVICPKCRTVFVRLIGQWYKHCPECGKRMGTKEVAE